MAPVVCRLVVVVAVWCLLLQIGHGKGAAHDVPVTHHH
jgi:hypothetical protein